ncbi:MAG: Zn-ribbon domain-containing OB-fold protein [Proteobacteria bacterium]|nr:Zn-ribbon domain-containing OB-fold protein [Pseudomonadota bacterium]
MSAEVTRIEPRASEVSEPFWEATRDKRFLLQWCVACGATVFYPRVVCPTCLGDTLEWRQASGRGTVYAATVEHRPQNPGMAAMAPYVVALIDLEEGVRMMSNVVGCDPESVTIGMPVSLTWEPLSDGRHLPLFEPSKGA